MRTPSSSRVLIVAHQTADGQELMEAVRRRADEGPCTFTLVVPALGQALHPVTELRDHGIREAEARVEAALPPLCEAAGDRVVGVVGSPDPLAAVHDALTLFGFDEVIISMLPVWRSRWYRLDLPRNVRALGVPVTEVIGVDHQFDNSAA